MMKIHIKSNLHIFLLSLFLAFISVSSFAQQWGVVEKSKETKKVGNQWYYVHTVVKGNTLYSLQRTYEVSLEEIVSVNPGLEKDLKLGMVLLIPKVDDKNSIQQSIGNFDNHFYHVVKQGENLFGISKIYGVKLEDIISINQLKSNDISPGYHLKIPDIEIQEKPEPQKISLTQPSSKQSRYFEHKVKPKETLFSIAKHYGIGLETLKFINNFYSNVIHPNQIILIPIIAIDQQLTDQKKHIIHQVQPSEGLFGIARKYGVTLGQIKTLNPGISESLSIGQEIKIPRTPNTKGFIEHQVTDKKEKFTDIAKEYEVSVNNLKIMNPDATSKVKKGETVYIPVDFVDVTVNETKPPTLATEEKQLPEPIVYERDKKQVFNIALMLPLYLNDVDSLLRIDPQTLLSKRQEIRSFRFLEFLEGARIAVDSLRKEGMKVNFQVYDVQENEAKTALLLQDRTLRQSDLIISLLFSRSFAQVSDFSKENRIPLVNVLSKRRQIIFDNPYVFKINPKPEALYQRIAEFVGENMAEYNTIVVRHNAYQLTSEYNLLLGLLRDNVKEKVSLSNAETLRKIDLLTENKQQSFLDSLNRELSSSSFAYSIKELREKKIDTIWLNNSIKTVVYSNDSIRGVMKHASLLRDNLIIALGSDEIFAIEFYTKLNFKRKTMNFNVIGLPDWNNFNKLDVDNTQSFSMRVVSDAFVDYKSSNVEYFVKKFRKAYNKVPEIDTYAFLGYDATFYFMKALFGLGNNWIRNIDSFQLPLLQNQFHFEKQNQGGYENTYWNLYRQENYGYVIEK